MPRRRHIHDAPSRVARLANGLGALAVLVGITAGLPLALRYAAAVMLPHGWTPLAELPALTSPDYGTLFAQAIIAAGWGVWAVFDFLVLWEIARRLLGRQPHTTARVRTPHGLAGLLVAAIAALTSTPVSSAQATTVAVVATDTPLPSEDDQTPPEPATHPRYITHLVDRGEGLLDVAEKYQLTWEQVAEANYGRQQPDGGSLQPGRTVIYPGWQLRIPVIPTPETTPLAAEGESPTALNVAEQPVYEVVKGDWMWHIAGRYLGDEQRYTEIAALNSQYQERHPDYPDHIQPGDRLLLPHDAYDRGERAHATGALRTPPEPAEPVEPVEPPATDPSPEPDPRKPPPATATPSPTALAEPSTSPTGLPDATPGGEPPAVDDPGELDELDGVTLPSGTWISLGLAALIATAAAVLRAHRRCRARLSTRPIPLEVDPEPSPLPESLAAAEAAGVGVLDYSRSGPLPAGLLPTPPAPAAAGVTGAGESVSLLDWPQPVLAVHGDGAAAVVRALLAAAVTTGVSEHPGAQPQVVIPTGLLTRLLPPDVLPEGLDPDATSYDGERLEVVADPATAVLRREEEMVHRRRLLEATGAETVGRLVETGEHPEHLPPQLLVVDTDTAGGLLPRVVAVAAHRDTLDLHTILLGHAEGIPGWQVAGDGTLTPDPDAYDATGVARLSMLDERGLADVLDVARRLVPRSEPGPDTGGEPAGAASGPSVGVEAAVDGPGDGEPMPSVPPPAADAAVQVVPVPSDGTRPPVRLRVLGPVGLSTTAGPVTEGVRTGSLAVAALLAAHPHGRAMGDIAATLHPGENPDAARNLVRTDTSALRAILRRATGLDKRARFVVHDERRRLYQLDPDLVEVDLWQVLAAIGRANTADDDPACLAALREAVDGFTGDFADNLEATWAAAYAITIRGKMAQVWARIAEITEADQPDRAVAALEAAIEYEPVHEELVRRLLRIHGRHGNLDQVRTVMRRLESRLADLGSTEPSQETRAVAARQLARGRTDPDQPSRPAAEPAMTTSTS